MRFTACVLTPADPCSVCTITHWQLACWRSKNSPVQLLIRKEHWGQAGSTVSGHHINLPYASHTNLMTSNCSVEDTDQARSTPESEAAVLEDLKWIGIKWDEGNTT